MKTDLWWSNHIFKCSIADKLKKIPTTSGVWPASFKSPYNGNFQLIDGMNIRPNFRNQSQTQSVWSDVQITCQIQLLPWMKEWWLRLPDLVLPYLRVEQAKCSQGIDVWPHKTQGYGCECISHQSHTLCTRGIGDSLTNTHVLYCFTHIDIKAWMNYHTFMG